MLSLTEFLGVGDRTHLGFGGSWMTKAGCRTIEWCS